ncbi:hypothetical protein DFH11DRAFT_1516827 [Phellopilus nigrolimitatus]|nr:hypothetical protein DFH11DRAFT_1516827 [Phellopilus nigrolimitatus]
MPTTVEPLSDNSEVTASRESPSSETVSLPNVFVVPPEEEYDTLPWCCFDALKDAQPGALVYEDLLSAELDYSDHAEDDVFSADPVAAVVAEREERENVFAMRSLVEEAESLRERLRSLELSAGTRPVPATSTTGETGGGSENSIPTCAPSPKPEPPKVPRKASFFSFKPIGRKKSRKENPSPPSTIEEHNLAHVQRPEPSITGADLPASRGTQNPSFFSLRFKFSQKKSTGGVGVLGSNSKPSMDAHRSCETLEFPRLSREQDTMVKRRFSFFDLPRRRFSTLSQSTVPSIQSSMPSIMHSTNHSSSSLATSSVPPTPEGMSSGFASPSSTAIEKFNKDFTSEDPATSMISAMDTSIENLAASLTLPSAHDAGLTDQLALDPLHFESLQFNSDDFP